MRRIFFAILAGIFWSANVLAQGGYAYPADTGLPENPDGIRGILVNILNWLLMIIGVVALIAFVISGLQYLLSGGDERSMETAKRNAKYSIFGILVALSGYILVMAADAMLWGESF